MKKATKTAKNGKRSHLDRELAEKDIQLRERLKELNCIYQVAEIIENEGTDIDRTMQMIVEALPQAMMYPEITTAGITLGPRSYQTTGHAQTEWSLSGAIMQGGKSLGEIRVNYHKKKPNMDTGPFLKEEGKLLRVISENLSKYVSQYYSEAEVRNYVDQMKRLLSAKGASLDNMLGPASKPGEEWRLIIDILNKTDQQTYLMVSRKMMYHLARLKEESLESLLAILKPTASEEDEQLGSNIPNPRFDMQALIRVQQGLFDVASKHLSSPEIMDLLVRWLKENKARPLLLVSEQGKISLKEVRSALDNYMRVPVNDRIIPEEMKRTIVTNLIRRFLNDRPEYLNVAKDYLEIEDFHLMVHRFIGHYEGVGGLGGKSSMVFLIQRIINKEMKGDEDLISIRFPRSWYLSTGAMREFIHENALDDVVQIKYMDPNEIRKEQPFLEQLFKNGLFPSEIVNQLRDVLREIKDRPIIVRSSSHLEDSYGAAFSGKYKSLFLCNLGNDDERLNAVMDAIAEVWASTFGPNPIEYRRERGLLDLSENMGVLIQEVVGNRIGPYFAPSFAGVALSNNEFRWSARINRQDGILRMVMGLGTRAVDRVSNDYPLLISPMKPMIRVNTSAEDIARYSQVFMDVINMGSRTIDTIRIKDMIYAHSSTYPDLEKMISFYADGGIVDPKGVILGTDQRLPVVTFNGIVERTPFIRQMKKVLTMLKDKLRTPVDIEFAHDGSNLYILQCRPQTRGLVSERISLPTDVLEKNVLFRAARYVTSGLIKNIDWIVYVDPEAYERLESREDMNAVAGLVSRLNSALPKKRFLLMGPGRWGSRGDIKLGVPVQYGDINNTCLLIEIARSKGGYVPELSFGTHFFQDLVETGIQYLPLYPDEEGGYLNEQLLGISENHIHEHVQITNGIKDVVRLIRTSDISSGGSLTVVMEGESIKAVGYLTTPDHNSWRMERLQDILSDVDARSMGIEEIYLVGSVKENKAGPGSDIDLIVVFNGKREQEERLLEYFKEWGGKLDEENFQRTGIRSGCLLDVHVVTQYDITNKTSWASHIGSVYNPARKLTFRK